MAGRVLQILKRSLGIGRERFCVGHDLAGNSYYEKPLQGADHSRPKRFVNFKFHRNDPALYRNHHLAPQWSAWLAFTRNHPPTIEELQADHLRQQRLKENVRRLELTHQANKNAQSAPNQAVLAENVPTLPDLNESPHPQDNPKELQWKRKRMSESPLTAFVIQHQSNPDQHWQPQAWSPQASDRKT